MSEASGFWSYVHKDDNAEEGRISQLARDVVSQYEMISGDKILLFLDRDSLEIGDEWRPKVDNALNSIAFFVPILTPRYFQSSECRRELNFFARRAKDLGISELIMPIKYIDFPGLTEENPMDDAIILARSFQWEDWTEIRFSSRTSSEYRRAVTRIAHRMYAANLSSEKATLPTEILDAAATEDDELGFVDIIAKAESTFPEWSNTLEKLGVEITAIGKVLGEAGAEIQQGDRRGSSYATRLAIIQRAASGLEQPATRIEELANDYSNQLHDLDRGITLVIDMIPSEIENNTTPTPIIQDFCESISGLAGSAAESLGHMEALTNTFGQIEGSARSIRPVARRLKKSLTLLMEAREISQEWLRKINDVDLPEND